MNTFALVAVLVGGSAVLASYIWGIFRHPDKSIWAGITILPLFILSAIVSAIGFIWFAYCLIWTFPPDPLALAWTIAFLLSEACFMPLAIAGMRRSVFMTLLTAAISSCLMATMAILQLGTLQALPVLWLAIHCTIVDLGFWFGTWKPQAKELIPTAQPL